MGISTSRATYSAAITTTATARVSRLARLGSSAAGTFVFRSGVFKSGAFRSEFFRSGRDGVVADIKGISAACEGTTRHPALRSHIEFGGGVAQVQPMIERFDVVVLGAGAAGLMCAAVAGARGRRVVVLDHGREVGAKILISGGGRCNFTNQDVRPERFISANPRFCRSALSQYTADDFVALVRRHGIAFHTKTLGQLFCDGSARQVVAMLLAECEAARVAVRPGTRIGEVSHAGAFRVETEAGPIEAASLVVATGGLSIPKIGASGLGYRLAERFGLAVTALRPGLVPLTFEGGDLELMRPLSGVALPAVAQAGKTRFTEALLFTHRGLSGPAILQASSYLDPGGRAGGGPGAGHGRGGGAACGQAGAAADRGADRARRAGAAAARRRAGRRAGRGADGRTAGPRAAGAGPAAERLAAAAGGDGGLCQGRGDAWAGSTRRGCRPARWRPGRCRGCSSSARRWT